MERARMVERVVQRFAAKDPYAPPKKVKKLTKVVLFAETTSTRELVTKAPLDWLIDMMVSKVSHPNLMPVPKVWFDFYGMDEAPPVGISMPFYGSASDSNDLWYWPCKLRENASNIVYRPRYPDLYSAVVASLKEHHDQIHIATRTRGPHGRFEEFGATSFEFYDNDEYIEGGATEKWWQAVVAAAKPRYAPVEHKGSDDPMW